MSLGQYKEAAKTAIIIAREEQVLGMSRNMINAFIYSRQLPSITRSAFGKLFTASSQ